MRFRSVGISASNLEEYLIKLKKKENAAIEESTLAHIKFISLDENSNNDDEYDLLAPKSNYKIKNINKFRKRRKRKRFESNQYFRKKIFFYHKRKRINSETIKINTSNINLGNRQLIN